MDRKISVQVDLYLEMSTEYSIYLPITYFALSWQPEAKLLGNALTLRPYLTEFANAVHGHAERIWSFEWWQSGDSRLLKRASMPIRELQLQTKYALWPLCLQGTTSVGARAGLTPFTASWFATRCTLMRKDGNAETRNGFGLYESIFEKL